MSAVGQAMALACTGTGRMWNASQTIILITTRLHDFLNCSIGAIAVLKFLPQIVPKNYNGMSKTKKPEPNYHYLSTLGLVEKGLKYYLRNPEHHFMGGRFH